MKIQGLCVLSFILIWGCAGDTPGNLRPLERPISAVSEVAPGERCENGGVEVKSGTDIDGDGELDEDEVDQVTEVCEGTNGIQGVSSLVGTKTVDSGSACPEGGVEIETGTDDNGNGVLDEEEVDTTEVVCNGEVTEPPPPPAPPPVVNTEFVIDASGGDAMGDGSTGGDGGEFVAVIQPPTQGNLEVYEGGEAETSFELPDDAPYLGSNPLVLSASVSIPFFSNAEPGEIYWRSTGEPSEPLGALFKADSSLVTGLHIEAGVSVVLEHENSLFGSYIELVFSDGVYNEGTFATGSLDFSTDQRTDFVLRASSYVGGEDAVIDVSGVNATSPDGAAFTFRANISEQVGLLEVARGSFINRGRIDSSAFVGGNGGDGETGDGGTITVVVAEFYNSGEFDVSGGSLGSGLGSGGGGRGGDIRVEALRGQFINHGAMFCRGGDAVNEGNGGNAGTLSFLSTMNESLAVTGVSQATLANGRLYNGGDVNCRGGEALGTSSNYQAGGGGSITILMQGGEIRSSGNLDVDAGRGEELGIASTSTGAGGRVALRTEDRRLSDFGRVLTWSAGDITISGDLLARGSSSAGPSGGGRISIWIDSQAEASGQTIKLLGYGRGIHANGGQSGGSDGNGGVGGQVEILNGFCDSFGISGLCEEADAPAGGLYVYVDVEAHGGRQRGGTGTGGAGGTFSALCGPRGFEDANWSNTWVTKDIDVGGGPGENIGGEGGVITIVGYHGVRSNGEVNVSAGDGENGNGGEPAPNGGIGVFSNDGTVNISGVLQTSGAHSTEANGGDAARIALIGRSISMRGEALARGGDGGGESGAGGKITMDASSSINFSTGCFQVGAGEGLAANAGIVLANDIDISTDVGICE